MPFHKILCPICLTDHPQGAMTTAVRLTAAFGAELVIADSWSMPPMALAGDVGAFPSESLLAFEDHEERALSRIAAEAHRAGAPHVTSKLLAGAPTAEVLSLLDKDPTIDLVVLGVDDANRAGGPALPGPIKRILRHAPCSVLLAYPPPESVRFTKILCPVDFSAGSWAAATIACELADPEGTVTLLHVTKRSLRDVVSPERAPLEHTREALDALERWAGDMRQRTKAEIATVARFGQPAHEILDELDVGTFDLVVMGAYRPAAHRLGTVAAKLFRHATCPVLLAHPRD